MPTHNAIHPVEGKLSPHILQRWGPRLQVSVSMSEEMAKVLEEQGKPLPAPITGWGLIDTGASVSAVDGEALKKLGVPPTGQAKVNTPSGSARQLTYPVEMTFPGTAIPRAVFGTVTGSVLASHGLLALLGRDLLSHCVLVYNGTAGLYSLSI